MGFFSKVWKGVKKTFKKIGRGIKKAFKSVGKFMGKIGILGNIALVMLTGGLGIGGMFTSLGTKLGALSQTMSGPLAAIMKGASWTIGKAAQFGTAVKSGFSTLTKGVTEFFGQTAKYVGNKLNITNIQGAPTNLGEVWSNTSKAVSKQFETFKGDVGDLFSSTSPTLEAGKNVAEMDRVLKDSGMTIEQAAPSYEKDFRPVEIKQDTAAFMSSPVDAGVAQTAQADKGSFMDSLLKPSKPLEEQTFMERLTTPANYGNALATGVTQVPASLLTQSLIGAVQGTPDYATEPSYGSYAPQFASQDYGAVAQGLTPMVNDGYQDMVFAYDALGQQSGGYGGLYKQRLGAFA